MDFEADGLKGADTILFHAYTEKNVDKKILGGWKAGLGRLFGSNFKEGSLMRIAGGRFVSQKTTSGVLVTPFGNYYLNADLSEGRLAGLLSDGLHRAVGKVEGVKGLPRLPLRDYPTLLDSALETAERKLYDPALLTTAAWRDFKRQMQRISRLAKDDAAFVMSFFYNARKLPFSHFSLHARPESLPETDAPTADDYIRLEEKPNATAYLKIASFSGEEAAMDSIFHIISGKDFRNLIVDLRGNTGGSIEAGMGFVRHLLPDTVYGGIFLTRKYFTRHTTPPAPEAYRDYMRFSEANYDLLIQGISEYPGISLIAYPKPPVFRGRIYILTDGRTASTCEPIVYVLKRHRLATIVGTATAGAMLNGETFPIGDGFSLTVPTATYYTANGFRIDQQGVSPNIRVKANDALDHALRLTDAKPAQH